MTTDREPAEPDETDPEPTLFDAVAVVLDVVNALPMLDAVDRDALLDALLAPDPPTFREWEWTADG